MKDRINTQVPLIYKRQRVTFSDEMIDKYFRDRKIDTLISDIQSKYRDTAPVLRRYSRVSLKTQDNFKVGLSKRKSLRRTKSSNDSRFQTREGTEKK
jgi:hypothetical protein